MRKKTYNHKPFDPVGAMANEENLNLFFEMIYDRQMIWKRRFIDNSPAPWTDNAIFAKYKFCNLYREHDRSSQWEIRNIIMDESLSDKDLIWKILVYRTFNNPETFARALDKWPNGIPNFDEYSEDEFTAHINEIKSLGLNPFTNAYSITGTIKTGESISDAFCHIVIPAIHRSIDAIVTVLQNAGDPEQIVTFLMTLPGASAFTAHEYYQDFTYVSIYTDRSVMKFGQNDFTNLGPGSSQGVKLLFPKLKGSEQLSCYKYLQEIAGERLDEIALEKGDNMPYAQWNKELKKYDIIDECNLSLNQIEGALCEFSKYMRIRTGQGKPRCPEFKVRTSSIIVERAEDDMSEFITIFDEPDNDLDEGEVSAPKRGRGRPKNSKNKDTKHTHEPNILVGFTLNCENVDVLINKVKNFLCLKK